jgi:hypothetical protein
MRVKRGHQRTKVLNYENTREKEIACGELQGQTTLIGVGSSPATPHPAAANFVPSSRSPFLRLSPPLRYKKYGGLLGYQQPAHFRGHPFGPLTAP